MADLFIIGQFEGVASTTAVSIGSQIMHMLTVSLVLTVLLLALVHPIVLVMSTPAEAVDGTMAYLQVCFIGIPFITAYNIISSIFRGMDDSKSPMYFIAIACAANIGLDYLFMGVLRLGPAGAALGTTVSQAVSVAVSLVVIIKRRSLRLSKKDFKPRRNVMGKLLSIGVPIALQDGLIQIAFIVITIIANRRGLNDAAAVGIVEKIISFLFLVPCSFLHALHRLGAGCAEHRSKQTYRHRAGSGSRGVPDLAVLPHHPLPHGLNHGGRLLPVCSDLRDSVCGDLPQTHVPTAGVGAPSDYHEKKRTPSPAARRIIRMGEGLRCFLFCT